MKFYTAAIICSSLVASASAQNKIIFKGKVTGDTKGYNKVFTYTARATKDTAIISNGVFSIEFPYEGPVLQLFYDEYDIRNNGMYQPYGVLIEKPGTYYLTTDITKGFHSTKVTGGKTPELYQSFTDRQSAAFKQVNAALEKQYGKYWLPETDPKAEALSNSRDSLQKAIIVPMIMSFVKENKDSYVSAFAVVGSARNIMSVDELEQTYAMFSPAVKKTEDGKRVANYIQGLKSSAIGATVKNFTAVSPEGKQFDFASLKGKYVVIDFWASWCVPCRKSFPHMREVYQTFKSKDFEMLSISIDKDKAAWLKAVAQENNPWVQTLDDNAVADKGFAITGVPTTYLIDPQGKIILKEVGFESDKKGPMELKLEELFGKSVPVAATQKKEEKKEAVKMVEMKAMQ
ncbi:TlpA disulfide reductase family protein [Pinibacter aurantiacus]|uniref:AhpC/TSA family protein n=1 Tax=Pinibacter aurantiacus TaxID=2851599 RepID=A0A9E2S7G0_9BACT|nr:TlpA disulfide reductase family protein [Pinibacter aurantiacus]MBV4357606.1 AhpC/TSA family protein [Pinibacter aurantiacus]